MFLDPFSHWELDHDTMISVLPKEDALSERERKSEKERAVTTLCSAWRECAVLASNWELYFTTLGSDADLWILILFNLLPWGKRVCSLQSWFVFVCLWQRIISPFAFDSFSFISVFKLHTFLLILIVSYSFLLSANRYAEIN